MIKTVNPQPVQASSPSVKPAEALRNLAQRLNQQGLPYISVCRTKADRESLTVYVQSQAQKETVEQWIDQSAASLASKSSKGARRFFVDGKPFTIAVRTTPTAEEARDALNGDLKSIAASVGKGTHLSTVIADGKLRLSVDSEIIVNERERAGLEAYMLGTPGAGLSWMGVPLEIQAAALANAPFGANSQKETLERLQQATPPGTTSTVRFQEGAAPGKLVELSWRDGALAIRDFGAVESPWTPIKPEEFWSRASEIRFDVEAPKPPLSQRVNIDEVAPTMRQRLADSWVNWIRDTGMVQTHEAWHAQYGSGGTRGTGSGELFMQFHSNMMESFKTHLRENGGADILDACNGEIPEWTTTRPLPPEFTFPGMMGGGNINWPVPEWLTAQGGGQTFQFEGRSISKLDDIRTIDELGQCLGLSGVHAVGHVRLGGTMSSFASVGVSPFLLWHGKMEVFRNEWLKTQSGQKFLAQNPSGWTDPNANHHDHSHHHMAMAEQPRHAARTARAPETFADELIRLAALQGFANDNVGFA